MEMAEICRLDGMILFVCTRARQNDCVSLSDYRQVVSIGRASALEIGGKSKRRVWKPKRYITSLRRGPETQMSRPAESPTTNVAVEEL
jgi:hypothetical protein